MDLSNLKIVDSPVELVINHPATDEPLIGDDGQPVTFLVSGTDSEAFKKVDKAINEKRLQMTLKGRVKRQYSVDDMDRDNFRRIAACIVGWKNVVMNGNPVEFCEDNVKLVLKEFPWIQEQVEDFVFSRANFIKA